MNQPPVRDHLLINAFADIPSEIAGIPMRPLSAGSFSLLGLLGNPMVVGKTAVDANPSANFEAVVQYAWVHSADLAKVCAITKPEQLPDIEIRELAFQITIGQAFAFLQAYQQCALRLTASLAEVETEEDEVGKPGKPLHERPPVGLQLLSMHAAEQEIPAGSAISSGSCPSNGPSAISTLPTTPTEPIASGPAMILPDLPTAMEATTPPK